MDEPRTDQFVLITQEPNPKTLGLGVLSVDRNGDAHFFGGSGGTGAPILAAMERARLEFAAANGIMLSGMEFEHVAPNGARKYRYQRWWLIYPQSPA